MRKLRHNLSYDLIVGGRESLSRILAYLVALVIALLSFVLQVLLSDHPNDLTVVNALAYLCEGSPALGATAGVSLMLPITWLTLQALIYFIVVSYPSSALEHDSFGTVIRMGRIGWWLSKWLWSLICVTVCFVAMLAIAVAMTIPLGGVFSGFNPQGSFFLYEATPSSSTFSDTEAWSAFVCCYFSSLALATMGTVLSIIIGPRYAYAALIFLVVTSIYLDSIVLFPQFGMLVRGLPYQTQALTPLCEILISLLVVVASLIAGLIVIRRRNWFA